MYNESENKGYIDGGIRFFYLEDNKYMSFDYHYHTFHKCTILVKGNVNYTIEGKEYVLQDGDIVWIPRLDAHKLDVSEKKEYQRLVIYIDHQFLELVSKELSNKIDLMGKRVPNHLCFENEKRENLRSLSSSIIEEIKHMSANKNRDVQLLMVSYFLKWCLIYFEDIHWFESDNRIKKNAKEDVVISSTINYIKSHIHEVIHIEDIASSVHISKYHLMRRFKQVMGVTIVQFLTQERLALSRVLMKEGYPLTNIAYMVGFQDYTTFARSFKKIYDLSPRKFMFLNPSNHVD